MAIISLPVFWREKLGITDEVHVEGGTLREVLARIDELTGQAGLLGTDGRLSPFVNVFVDGAPARGHRALARELTPASSVRVVAALAGG